jgi:hypothetical protein
MSKSYKLKRAYTLLKALAAIGIGGLAFNSFIVLASGSTDTQDLLTVVIGFLGVVYFAASYSKANMEKEDLMEKTLKAVEALKRTADKNKAWGKATKDKAAANALKIAALEKKQEK